MLATVPCIYDEERKCVFLLSVLSCVVKCFPYIVNQFVVVCGVKVDLVDA